VLILIAHGSHDARWRASVESVVRILERELGETQVSLAYMDCTPPTLGDVVTEGQRRGVTRFRVLPLFLATEGHVERDVHPIVEAVRTAHRSADVTLLDPVGQHPLFRELLRRIATEAT
jgi:sirohydrochlorin cobaltochelatase